MVARIFIATHEVRISTLQLWLGIKRKKAEEILAQLQTLKIISTYKNGTYKILVNMEESEKIFRELKKGRELTSLF